MPKIIQDWLGTRLGMLLDMSPRKFGRNTKDGKLLAKLLYSYGVIPLEILEKIRDCTTCYDCLSNLAIIKPYLQYIGVNYDDSTFQKMAGGDGTAAISVFYAIFLMLERKGRLRYFRSQKERRFPDGCNARFKVDWVPEKALKGEPEERDTKLATPLVENVDLVKLHEEKCKEVIESIKKAKKKFDDLPGRGTKLGPVISKNVTSQSDKGKGEAETTMNDIDVFSKKHPEPCDDLDYGQLVEMKKKYEKVPCAHPCLREGKAIVGNIKRRKRGEIFAHDFQQKMQQLLLEEQWKQIVERQDKDFEDKVCANLLKQSQYEKQMVTKLHLIKHQKKVTTENRRMLECLKLEQADKEYNEMMHKKRDLKMKDFEEEEFERKRIAELHRRTYDNKARMRNARIRKEARKIYDSLVDIAIRIAEVREDTGCQVPKALMKDMKELFFKDLPIFDILDYLEELYEDNKIELVDETECYGEDGIEQYIQVDTDYDQMKYQEMERQNILNECDLNDYLQLLGPWMVELLFPDKTESEGKHLVLGYIVHKLLQIKYPCQNKRKFVEIKQMKTSAVVANFKDTNALEMFIDLMELCGVLVVKVDDAINFVLLAYKEELSAVKDIDIKADTDTLKTKSIVREKEDNKKSQLLKKPTETLPTEEVFNFADKQTQTPRTIPEDEIALSSDAEIGKYAFEALAAGDPVPDAVIITAIVSYVKSKQDNYCGWVLLNYPVLYSQARELEYSLIGYYTLPVLDEMETLEEAEGFTYRGPWRDAFTGFDRSNAKESRLVPKPDCLTADLVDIPQTYFHAFVRMKGTPHSTPENYEFGDGPLEKFYTQQGTFVDFEYQNLNFQTVKNLGKVIMTNHEDSGSGVISKTSVEYFGSGVLELDEKWEPKKKTEKEGSKGVKVISISKEVVTPPVVETVEEESKVEETTLKETEETPVMPLPGEPGWEWAEGPQPEEYLFALASLWENMEVVYLEDLKTVFFCLRAHRSNVLRYNTCIRQSIRTLMRRPDEKQKVLSEFQKMYNEIDPDLRPDVDVKCELHVRVSELEQVLMGIADERKINSQRDLTKIAQDNWVPDEMAHLINTYLTALQLEADRCIDSVQLIMDYYTLLQQKIPEENSLEKVSVPRINIQNGKYAVTLCSSSKGILSPKASESKRGKLEQSKEKVRTRSFLERKRRGSDGSDLPGAAEVVTQILTNLTLPEDSLTPFHNFFVESVKMVSGNVKNILDECIAETRKSDKALTTAKAGKNGKKTSDVRVVPGNLLSEWSAALEDEMNRFFFRAKLLLARGIFEMNEFLTTILNILSSLSDDITDMYMKEIHSISECCKVFRCFIEEEKAIQSELELKEDEFIVNMDVVVYHPDEEEYFSEREIQSKFVFSVEQLSLLRSKLQMVAPDGEIIRRAFLYILEDLKTLNPEAGPKCFSERWENIEPDDLIVLFDSMYLNLEIVNWKDFIIYALDLPVPSMNDILEARSNFRKFDPLITEVISRECYEKVRFWFEISLAHASLADRYEKVRTLLFEMYQVNETHTNYSALLLALCKDPNPVDGFIKALALAEGKKVSRGNSEGTSLMEEDAGEYLFGDYKLGASIATWKPNSNRCCAAGMNADCIPKARMRCNCVASEKGSIEDKESIEGGMEGERGEGEVGEGGFLFDYEFQTRVPYVSFNILTTLLKASFPSLPQFTLLLDCSQTFQETLNSVYDSLEPINGKVEVDKLIKHKFINCLLHSTNKFKYLNFRSILRVDFNSRTKTSGCASDRLALTKCLNLKDKIFS